MPASPSLWRDLAPASLLLVASAAGIAAATILAGPDSRQVAVVAPPWYGAAQAIGLVERAGGSVVDLGGVGNVVVAVSEDADFIASLYREGAWLALNPIIARGCFNL